jgi:hypothetical protein
VNALLRLCIACAALAAAGAAAQPSPAPSAGQPAAEPQPPRKPLNLRLDAEDMSRARITFGERPDPGKSDAAEGLPSLGGGARTFDAPPSAPIDRGSLPFPKDTEAAR